MIAYCVVNFLKNTQFGQTVQGFKRTAMILLLNRRAPIVLNPFFGHVCNIISIIPLVNRAAKPAVSVQTNNIIGGRNSFLVYDLRLCPQFVPRPVVCLKNYSNIPWSLVVPGAFRHLKPNWWGSLECASVYSQAKLAKTCCRGGYAKISKPHCSQSDWWDVAGRDREKAWKRERKGNCQHYSYWNLSIVMPIKHSWNKLWAWWSRRKREREKQTIKWRGRFCASKKNDTMQYQCYPLGALQLLFLKMRRTFSNSQLWASCAFQIIFKGIRLTSFQQNRKTRNTYIYNIKSRVLMKPGMVPP